MRLFHQKVASSLQLPLSRRSFHTVGVSNPSRLQPSAVLAQRSFHRTTAAYLPRRRNFFTSNVLLHQNDDGEHPSPLAKAEKNGAEPAENGLSAQPSAKRKPPRTGSVKNSLRRVAIIAQQPGGRTPPSWQTPSHPSGAGQDGIGASTTAAAPDGTNGGNNNNNNNNNNTISAVCVAQAFDMDAVLDILRAHGFALDPDGSGFEPHEVAHARGANGGDIFVFPSGTIVTWSLPAEVVGRLATRQLLGAAVDPHVSRREAEDLEYLADPARETSAVKGDLVVLGTRNEAVRGDRLDTTLAKIAFSSGLARSTKLAVLESSLTAYFESTRRIPAELSRNSRVALSRRFILQKTGELLNLRAQLNHYSELTDSLPDIFWDSRSELGLEGYYEQVGKALDVNVRIRTLNQKMDYAQDIASTLREMSSEKHSTRLEWIIILLIAVEVLFELRREYEKRTAGGQEP